MAQPYVGEIRMFAGNFAPAGWMFCSGQILPISENETLFNLIGTTYGGDGQSTFALPDLQSRVPIHMGGGAGLSARTLAETGGVEQVTLTVQQIPLHTHQPLANTVGASDSPNGNVWATASGGIKPYGADPGNAAMNAASLAQVGGSQPHDNMIPYLCVSFIISLFGVFPSQT
ncbi:phage tail protein [Flavisolibacter ginsenosidimutans]|uniref:Phage tail protein n=1 Tax=Flavisolibacter ginsenosidimutans TaxID=661481 RepID=A0A5B8UMM7_9BACT|nr:tail fiber protein [Flavisolibacter ginsenosidimutans]QEC57931.1 phage tail protein [Flavisolibacter ginsenosidimutans]